MSYVLKWKIVTIHLRKPKKEGYKLYLKKKIPDDEELKNTNTPKHKLILKTGNDPTLVFVKFDVPLLADILVHYW